MSQWIREYFLSAALLQIGSVIISCSFFLIIISKLIIKDNFDKSFSFHDGYILFSIALIIFFWLISAPETRYALGPIISLPCFFIYLIFKRFNFLKLISKKSFHLTICMSIICLLLFIKNVSKFENQDLFVNNYKISPNYSHIEKIGTFSDNDFYWGKFNCIDFKKICVNTVKQHYIVEKILNFKVYKSNNL